MGIECLNPAYEKIKAGEINKRISDKNEIIYNNILLYKSPYFEGSENMFNNIRGFYFNKDRGISEKSKVFEGIIKLERDIDEKNYFSPTDFEKVLLEHPYFLSYIILGDEMFDYKKFNFPSLRSLSESITSFCIGERSFSDEYIWRFNNFKNRISRNTHGDLFVGQYNISGKSSLENTLFGNEEIFDISSDVRGVGISAYQDWSSFLVGSLKYAECLGKEKMREITGWKEVLEEAGGGIGNNSAEAFGMGSSDYELKFLMDAPIFQENIKLERYPLYVCSQGLTCSYPYFKGGKLLYLIEDERGEILMENLSNVYKDKKFYEALEYSEEDLPDILTATYKYFARDRSRMHKIMELFNESHKWTYSNTAFILLTPLEEDSSFIIFNFPNSQVFFTWGPAQISFEQFPIV